jgi:hypothetical protein
MGNEGFNSVVQLHRDHAPHLLVLIWYTVETQRLRKEGQAQTDKTSDLLREAQRQNEVSVFLLQEAQRQNEVTVMPILAISVDPVSNEDRDRVVLTNVGSGPAFKLSIDPLQWDGRKLKIEHGSSILRSGQTDDLQFHFVEGQSGNLLGAKTLGPWIHLQRVPSPFRLIVRCNSVNSRAYVFGFVCTSAAGRLRIRYEGTASADVTTTAA